MPAVLLVDDDPDNQLLLSLWLRKMGHTVLRASSAVEALHLMDEHGVPDVAVLDIVMDQISGLDLLDHLRHHHPACAHMPAILPTARHLDSDTAAAADLKAVLMIKPPDRARLKQAIDQALQTTAR